MRIGYVGLGALGSELARRLLTDHTLTVWDLNPSSARAFEALGARAATSAADLARVADVVLTCLPRSSDVRQLVFGPGGLIDGLSAGTLVIDQTSGVPTETREIAEQLAERDVAMMDAAVSASPHIVAQGAAVLMTAGPDSAYEKALPALRAISQTIYRCGDRVGDGQAMKMVNNAMNAGCRLGTLEVAAMGRKAGLTLDCIASVLNKGSSRNQTTERMLPALVEGKSSTNFALSLMLKDVNQAVMLGMELGVPMPISSIVRGLLQIGVNTLGNDARLEDMVSVIASMAGTDFAPPNDRGAVPGNDAESRNETGRVAKLLQDAVSSLCRLVTYECVATGRKYGLALETMSEVLNKSSGWSAASQEILPALVSGRSMSGAAVESNLEQLRQATRLGANCGAPMMISSVVLSIFEAAAHMLGRNAKIEEMARYYEMTSSIKLVAA